MSPESGQGSVPSLVSVSVGPEASVLALLDDGM